MTTLNDLLFTAYCPLGFRCEHCGMERDGMAVIALQLRAGVACLTLCPKCIVLPALLAVPARPAITMITARHLVADHAAHLSISVRAAERLVRELRNR